MNTFLWIFQALLAILFLFSGINKSLFSQDQLIARGQTGVAGKSASTIRFIGISEIFGAVALILPGPLRIWPFLTPVAALCLGIIMILAAPIHYRLHEKRNVVVNLILLLFCLFVAIGRFVS